jgi:hypothetical protein
MASVDAETARLRAEYGKIPQSDFERRPHLARRTQTVEAVRARRIKAAQKAAAKRANRPTHNRLGKIHVLKQKTKMSSPHAGKLGAHPKSWLRPKGSAAVRKAAPAQAARSSGT